LRGVCRSPEPPASPKQATNLPLSVQPKHPVVPVGKLFTNLRHILVGDAPPSNGSAPALKVTVRCGECGEAVTVRVDKASDLLCEFDESHGESEECPAPSGYTLRKEVVGRRCQNLVHFSVHFDEHRRTGKHEIEGGEFVKWEDVE
jgi:hypothetical protein